LEALVQHRAEAPALFVEFIQPGWQLVEGQHARNLPKMGRSFGSPMIVA
jgi:hypothetical protein